MYIDITMSTAIKSHRDLEDGSSFLNSAQHIINIKAAIEVPQLIYAVYVMLWSIHGRLATK